MEGLSNEIPFFIYHYPPENELPVREIRDRVTTKLQTEDGLRIANINMYDLAVDLLRKRGVWDRLAEFELQEDKREFREGLQNMLEPKAHLAPAIRSILAETPSDMVFLAGLGEVWPYIRTHTVLENLQSVVTEQPLLLWFPGRYAFSQATGHELRPLNLSASDSYYRAKDIMEQEA
ncbi:DUF1788 domain-containing protein [Leucobacter insecticola]|uniref:DUF1788 domain-containing protein n=2 Tax=Leucobacter insecticola TaxID=2714934 RepID=A0A6G8FLP9_9MICO|nr:DUF1788 domain-containing protein [Leucobacter insecticola]